MRITTHTALSLDTPRTSPARLPGRPVTSSVTPGATKPTFLSPAASTSSDPFASLFQTFSQTVGQASSTGTASLTNATAATVTTATTAASTASSAASTTTTTTSTGATAATAATTAAASVASTASAVANPGIQALVSAIENGSLKVSYVTDPSKLQETTPYGNATMPNFFYASDQTAAQIAQLLGGTVVQMPAFGQDKSWSEPMANFVQLPNGMTVNAADLAYYGRCGVQGGAQLTADLTQTINEGSAWTNYYKFGGNIPSFQTGYVGPPISGMTYPDGMIGADGNVINPAMPGVKTNT